MQPVSGSTTGSCMHPGSGELEVVDRMLSAEHEGSGKRVDCFLDRVAQKTEPAVGCAMTAPGRDQVDDDVRRFGKTDALENVEGRSMNALPPSGRERIHDPPSTLVDASCLRRLFCLVLAMTSGTRHHRRALCTPSVTGRGVREIWW